MPKQGDFGFGLETEFLLVDSQSFNPLWYQDLEFEELNSLLESIDHEDFTSRGLNVKPLHKRPMPYLVEGYYVPDDQMKPVKLLPKGVEIRTPVCDSIDECLQATATLHERLQARLRPAGYQAAVLSHHPTAPRFEGKQNYRRYDYWQWALIAMTTYGPDVNISIPEKYSKKLEFNDLAAKVNYYAPALTALTVASPIVEGSLWRIRNYTGKSIRTYRRSVFAPPMYIHEKPHLRFELKCLEMSRNLDDYGAYLILWLTVLLDDTLKGRATAETRIYDMGQVARFGLAAEGAKQRAGEVVERAFSLASTFGPDKRCLMEMQARIETERVPADEIIALLVKERSLPAVLAKLVGLVGKHPAASCSA